MRVTRKTSLAVAAVSALTAVAAGLGFVRWGAVKDDRRGFVDRASVGADGKPVRYVLYVPPDYRPDREWPLIVFLHGTGERGTDGRVHLRVGLAPSINRLQRQGTTAFEFLALFPQSRSGTWEPGSADEARLEAALADVRAVYRVDPSRLYLTGHSSGGSGTWELAANRPGRWAAIVPVCGGFPQALARPLSGVPAWYFQGTADEQMPVEQARAMIDSLRVAGGNPRFTEYPGGPHGIWPLVYTNAELYEWLHSNRLNKNDSINRDQ